MKKQQNNILWFSIIEVLIGIFVFSLGLVSIYALLVSSLNVNEYNKNAIIASNLAREQLEFFRNIRDTNYTNFTAWNQINPENPYSATNVFQENKYYTLESDFSWLKNFPIVVNDITVWFESWENHLTSAGMQKYRLCLDTNNKYTYDCATSGHTRTAFFRYLFIEKAQDSWMDIDDAYRVTSKVIWYKRWYHEYDIKTVVSDWRRI